MKRLTLMLLACCLYCLATGQETMDMPLKKKETVTKEWGVNATKLLAWGLRRDQRTIPDAPYVISYKAIQANKNTFRLFKPVQRSRIEVISSLWIILKSKN